MSATRCEGARRYTHCIYYIHFTAFFEKENALHFYFGTVSLLLSLFGAQRKEMSCLMHQQFSKQISFGLQSPQHSLTLLQPNPTFSWSGCARSSGSCISRSSTSLTTNPSPTQMHHRAAEPKMSRLPHMCTIADFQIDPPRKIAKRVPHQLPTWTQHPGGDDQYFLPRLHLMSRISKIYVP